MCSQVCFESGRCLDFQLQPPLSWTIKVTVKVDKIDITFWNTSENTMTK